MVSSFSQNDVLIAMISTMAGDDIDLEPVRVAFEKTQGDFRAKFTAAVLARLAPDALPEVFIELPDNPEQLLNARYGRSQREPPKSPMPITIASELISSSCAHG